jgi:hypothetical protein
MRRILLAEPVTLADVKPYHRMKLPYRASPACPGVGVCYGAIVAAAEVVVIHHQLADELNLASKDTHHFWHSVQVGVQLGPVVGRDLGNDQPGICGLALTRITRNRSAMAGSLLAAGLLHSRGSRSL